MPIIDSQVHCYERNHPARPWVGTLAGPAEVTGAQMVAAMDAVGVDGALLVSPYAMYRFDGSYALEVGARHPGRFGLIKPFDPTDPGVAEAIADWAGQPDVVGLRLMLYPEVSDDPADPGLNRVAQAAAKHGLPLNMLCWGRLDQGLALARRNPGTQFVIDHCGLQQPFAPPPPAAPFAALPKVLAFATLPNVAIKISGACTLSHAGYPYADIWDPLARLFDGFGLERCLWGTDWTRAVALLSYAQGVDAFRVTDRLTASEKARLMGGALERIYRWRPRG